MNTDKQKGFAGLIVLTIAAVALGGVFYFLHDAGSNSPINLGNGLPQIASAIQSQVTIEPEVTVTSSTPLTNNGLALYVGDVASPKLAQKKKLVVNTGTEEVPQVKPSPVVTMAIVEEKITEPTLIVEQSEQVNGSLLLADARRVPFTKINLTAQGGDVTVQSLTIERRGIASDRLFVEVGVLNHGIEKRLNASHQYKMNEPFTITNGETEEIILYGNIIAKESLASYVGQSPSLALIEIMTSAKISGSLPLVGTTHIANSTLTIGSLGLTTSGLDPGVNRNFDVNATNVIFSAVRITAGSSEPLLLREFGWTQNGSAGAGDLSNIQTCIDYKNNRTCYPSDSEDGKYYYTDFENNIRIDKGESADVYIKGDVLPSGANRTVNFDITTSYDISAYGLTYKNYFYTYGGENEGAQPEGSLSTSEYPFYNGYTHNIVSGSFNSISR